MRCICRFGKSRSLEANGRYGTPQSELIRKGIRSVTAAYRKRARPVVGWLKLSKAARAEPGFELVVPL